MKILRVKGSLNDRYFLIETQRDYENVALKLLNERRVMELDSEPALKDFIERVTDEQDGDLAISMLSRLYDVEGISPEVV